MADLGTYQRMWLVIPPGEGYPEPVAFGPEDFCNAKAAEVPGAKVVEMQPPEGEQWVQRPDGCWTLREDV